VSERRLAYLPVHHVHVTPIRSCGHDHLGLIGKERKVGLVPWHDRQPVIVGLQELLLEPRYTSRRPLTANTEGEMMDFMFANDPKESLYKCI
jgi:hypothetical protein